MVVKQGTFQFVQDYEINFSFSVAFNYLLSAMNLHNILLKNLKKENKLLTE